MKVANDVGTFLDKIGGLQTIAIALAAITFATPIAGILSMVTGLVRLATFAVPLAIAAFGKLGKAKGAANAAETAAEGAAESGAGAEEAGAAGKGLLARLAPMAVRLGLPLWLMTHSEGLNTGEDAYLAQHRAPPGAVWQGDAISAGPTKNPAALDAVAQFQKMGWSRAQAAGIAANLWKESRFDAGAVGDHGHAYGLAQWHADRQAQFKKLFGIDIHKSTMAQQLQFVDYELRHGTEQRAGSMLAGAKSAQDAGSIVARYYERPAETGAEAAARAKIAGDIFSKSPSAPDTTMSPIYQANAGAQSGAADGAASAAASAAPESVPSAQHIYLEIDMKNAPQGTTAKVRPSPNVSTSVRIGRSAVGGEPI